MTRDAAVTITLSNALSARMRSIGAVLLHAAGFWSAEEERALQVERIADGQAPENQPVTPPNDQGAGERRGRAAVVQLAAGPGAIMAAAGLALIPSSMAGQALRPGAILVDCRDCPEMVVIPRGSFTMGLDDDSATGAHSGPAHRVDIGYDFAVSKFR